MNLNPTSPRDISEESSSTLTLTKVLKYAPGFYTQSIPLMANCLYPFVLNIMCFYYIKYYDNAYLTAGFGLGNSLYLCLFFVIIQINEEISGLQLSQSYGAQHHKSYKLIFYRSVIINYAITFLAIAFYFNIYDILTLIGFERNCSKIAAQVINSIIPALLIQAYNEIYRCYLVSQNIHKPFVYQNVFLLIISIPLSYLFIYKLDLSIYGFAILKTLIEIINFFALVMIDKYQADDKFRIEFQPNFDLLPQIFDKNFTYQIQLFFKIAPGFYSSYLGMEMNTLIIGLLQDEVMMSSWVCLSSTSQLVFTIGLGVSNTSRTRIGIILGEGDRQRAKRTAYICAILVYFISIVTGLLTFFFRYQIASFFTLIPEIHDNLVYMLSIYGFRAILDGAEANNCTMLRMIRKSVFYSAVTISMAFIVWNGQTVLFIFGFGWEGTSVVISAIICSALTASITLPYWIFYDWDCIELEIDQQNNEGICSKQINKEENIELNLLKDNSF